MFQHIGACGNPSVFQEFWNVHRTCLLAVPLLFFLHRHDDVTQSWFRALEYHVLRVPNGNGMKKWYSPSSLSSPSVLVWFLAASRKQHSCLHLYCATTESALRCKAVPAKSMSRQEKPDLVRASGTNSTERGHVFTTSFGSQTCSNSKSNEDL